MADSKGNVMATDEQRPNLPRRLFWDWNYEKIDWEKLYVSIIDRVIERGTKEEWEALVSYYGEIKIINALKTEVKYLPDYIIDDVCSYFNLKQEELACYARKQARRGHWI